MKVGGTGWGRDSRIAGCSLLLLQWSTASGSRGSRLQQEAAEPRAKLFSFSLYQVVTYFFGSVPRCPSVLIWDFFPGPEGALSQTVEQTERGCSPRCIGDPPHTLGGLGEMRPSEAIQILSRRQPRKPCGERTSLYSAQQRGRRAHPPRASPLFWLGPALGPVCPRHPEKRARYKYFLVLFIYLLTGCCPNEEVVFLRAGPGLSGLLMNHQFQEEIAPPHPTLPPPPQ